MNRILIIDDDTELLESISGLLGSLLDGASIITAGSGREGLEMVKAELPDTILLDLSMPGMDGFEVIRRLKSDNSLSNIPIIMMTGMGTDTATRVKGLELGADVFLNKPFDPGELAAQIGAMLRIREAEERLVRENQALKVLNDKLEHEVAQRLGAEEQLRQHQGALEGVIRERTSELNLLQDINRAVNMGESLEDVLRLTVTGVRDVYRYAACDIYFYDKKSDELRLAEISIDSAALKQVEKLTGLSVKGLMVKLDEGNVFHDVVHGRSVVISEDMEWVFRAYSTNKALQMLAGKVAGIFGFKSAMRAPLITKGEVIGVIGVARKGPISQEEGMALRRFSSQLAIAIHKAQTEEALNREYAFRRAIEISVRSGITAIDSKGKLIYVNPAFCDMLGYEMDELVGLSPPFPFWPPEDAKRISVAMGEALKAGALPENIEMKFIRKDSRPIAVILNASVFKDDAGSVDGLLASVTDITERKALEKRVLDIGEGERQSIGRDLHDGVGQHLTGTAFMAKALEDKLRKMDMSEAGEASTIVSLLNETIDKVRRIAGGMSPVHISSEECCAVFREIEDYAVKVLDMKVDFHCDGNIAIADNVALGQLYMIAREAVVNAAKHSGAEEIRMRLSGEDDRLELVVEDSGSGLANGNGNADGLGLSIMRYRAGMIGASLRIEGRTDGTRVICSYKGGS